MKTNDEQFEHLSLRPADAELIGQHEARFDRFAELAVPLVEVRQTSYWKEWERQTDARRALADAQRKLDEQLAATRDVGVVLDRLYADLVELFETTRAEVRISAPNGGDRAYVATRFKQSIDRGKRDGLLIPAVAGIVRARTEGFDHLAEARRPDLMVETLVLDKTKPYHHLFGAKTTELARARMEDYYAANPA